MKTADIRIRLSLGDDRDYKGFCRVLEKSLAKSNQISMTFRTQEEREIARNDICALVVTDTTMRAQFPHIVRAVHQGEDVTALVHLIYKINANYRKRDKRKEKRRAYLCSRNSSPEGPTSSAGYRSQSEERHADALLRVAAGFDRDTKIYAVRLLSNTVMLCCLEALYRWPCSNDAICIKELDFGLFQDYLRQRAEYDPEQDDIGWNHGRINAAEGFAIVSSELQWQAAIEEAQNDHLPLRFIVCRSRPRALAVT